MASISKDEGLAESGLGEWLSFQWAILDCFEFSDVPPDLTDIRPRSQRSGALFCPSWMQACDVISSIVAFFLGGAGYGDAVRIAAVLISATHHSVDQSEQFSVS